MKERLQRAADDAWKDLSARYPGASRPDVELVRVVGPDDWAAAIAGCMNDLGFTDVTASEDGGVDSGAMPTSQGQGYDLASFSCAVEYPEHPKYSDPLTSKQITLIYTYYKDTLAPCLDDQGYSISPAPSLQTFQQTYDSGPWLPYAEILTSVTPKQLHALDKLCPEVPPNLWD